MADDAAPGAIERALDHYDRTRRMLLNEDGVVIAGAADAITAARAELERLRHPPARRTVRKLELPPLVLEDDDE